MRDECARVHSALAFLFCLRFSIVSLAIASASLRSASLISAFRRMCNSVCDSLSFSSSHFASSLCSLSIVFF